MSGPVSRLGPDTHRALHDLADARDRAPGEVAREALRRHPHEEGRPVRAVAEPLRRLGG